jgi:hypothetical protein
MTFILPGGLGQLFAGGGPTAWNPAFVGIVSNDVPVFSNNNLSIRGSNGFGAFVKTRATKGQTSGQLYFEVTVAGIDANVPTQSVGLANSSWLTSASGVVGGDTNSWALTVSSSGIWASWSSNSPTATFPTAAAAGDVIGVAVSITTTMGVWFRLNGIWLTTGGTPGAAFPAVADFGISGTAPFFPATSATNAGTNTINTGKTAFQNAPPTGYVAWG